MFLHQSIWWSSSRWYFQTFFNPYLGKWSILTNIFQMGWNHRVIQCQGKPNSENMISVEVRDLLTKQFYEENQWKWLAKLTAIRLGTSFKDPCNSSQEKKTQQPPSKNHNKSNGWGETKLAANIKQIPKAGCHPWSLDSPYFSVGVRLVEALKPWFRVKRKATLRLAGKDRWV